MCRFLQLYFSLPFHFLIVFLYIYCTYTFDYRFIYGSFPPNMHIKPSYMWKENKTKYFVYKFRVTFNVPNVYNLSIYIHNYNQIVNRFNIDFIPKYIYVFSQENYQIEHILIIKVNAICRYEFDSEYIFFRCTSIFYHYTFFDVRVNLFKNFYKSKKCQIVSCFWVR